MKYAGPLLTHVHIADSFDHRASSGLRYIVNPPGSAARVHQHLDIGQGDVDWDVFFGTLTETGFDGIAAVCVFAWEERARESSACEPRPDPAVPGQARRTAPVTRRVRIGLGLAAMRDVSHDTTGQDWAGLGRMGRIHAANLAGRCPSAQLACVFDADAEVARQVSEQHGVPRAGSYEDILADDGIDAVAIAVPTQAHAELSVGGQPGRKARVL